MAASARLDELKKKFEENPRRYFAPYANEHRKQGDLVQAVAICRAHLPNQPGHISGHIVLAQSLHEAQELGEARLVFEQALDLDPENLIALRSLGDIARVQGDLAGARGWFHRVLESDPRNDEVAVILRNLAASDDEQVAPAEEPVEAHDPNRTPISNPAIPVPESAFAPPAAEVPTPATWYPPAAFAPSTVEAPPEPVSSFSAPQATISNEDDAFGSSFDDERALDAEPFVEDTAAFAAPMHQMGEFEALAEPSDDWFAVPAPAAQETRPALTDDIPAAPPPVASLHPAPPALSVDDFGLPSPESEARAEAQPDVEPWFAAGTEAVDDGPPIAAGDLAVEVSCPDDMREEQGEDAFAVAADVDMPESSPRADATEPEGVLASLGDVPSTPSDPDVWSTSLSIYSGSGAEEASEAAAPAAFESGAASLVEAEGDSVVSQGTASLFVTETMAELYLQQGFTEEALQVYRQLLAASPGDTTLIARIALLEDVPKRSEPAGTDPAGEAAPRPMDPAALSVRSFFGRIARKPVRHAPAGSALDTSSLGAQLAQRHTGLARETPAQGTLAALFGATTVGSDDDAAAVRLASVFAPSPPGKPARQAESELSLERLFRDVPVEPSSAVTLDSFFAPPKSGGGEGAFGEQDAPGNLPHGEGPADIEQFTAWLEGLKKK